MSESPRGPDGRGRIVLHAMQSNECCGAGSDQWHLTTGAVMGRRYEFLYRQAVSTADNFLGMSGKDPSSSCCEELLVHVQLPGAESIKGARVLLRVRLCLSTCASSCVIVTHQ